MINVDEIETGKAEPYFLLLIKVQLSTKNLSFSYDLLEINILAKYIINILSKHFSIPSSTTAVLPVPISPFRNDEWRL